MDVKVGGVAIKEDRTVSGWIEQANLSSECVMLIVIKAPPKDTMIIQVCMPITADSDEDVEKCYENTEEAMKKAMERQSGDLVCLALLLRLEGQAAEDTAEGDPLAVASLQVAGDATEEVEASGRRADGAGEHVRSEGVLQAGLRMQDLPGTASRRGSFEQPPFFPFVLLVCNVLEAPRTFFVVIVRETFCGAAAVVVVVHGAAGDVSGAERGFPSKVAAGEYTFKAASIFSKIAAGESIFSAGVASVHKKRLTDKNRYYT
ncbi:unnamed protein product [Caretta caretta]